MFKRRAKFFNNSKKPVKNLGGGITTRKIPLIVGIFHFQVKYAVLLCGDDEDTEVVKAASGGLAMLTAQSKKCCEKVFEVSITGKIN